MEITCPEAFEIKQLFFGATVLQRATFFYGSRKLGIDGKTEKNQRILHATPETYGEHRPKAANLNPFMHKVAKMVT